MPVIVMATWLLLLWLVTAIEPFSRRDWLLENLLMFFYCGLQLVTWRRFRFSVLSYLLLTIFMSLHLVGAHDTYSEVPFGFWLQDVPMEWGQTRLISFLLNVAKSIESDVPPFPRKKTGAEAPV
jgi:uncharacterized membrane protein YjdF